MAGFPRIALYAIPTRRLPLFLGAIRWILLRGVLRTRDPRHLPVHQHQPAPHHERMWCDRPNRSERHLRPLDRTFEPDDPLRRGRWDCPVFVDGRHFRHGSVAVRRVLRCVCCWCSGAVPGGTDGANHGSDEVGGQDGYGVRDYGCRGTDGTAVGGGVDCGGRWQL